MNESRLKYKQTILLYVLFKGHVIWRSITAITYQHLLPDCIYQNTVPPGSILFFSVEKGNETINHLFPDIQVEQSASTCVSWPHFILLVTCYIPIPWYLDFMNHKKSTMHRTPSILPFSCWCFVVTDCTSHYIPPHVSKLLAQYCKCSFKKGWSIFFSITKKRFWCCLPAFVPVNTKKPNRQQYETCEDTGYYTCV